MTWQELTVQVDITKKLVMFQTWILQNDPFQIDGK